MDEVTIVFIRSRYFRLVSASTFL